MIIRVLFHYFYCVVYPCTNQLPISAEAERHGYEFVCGRSAPATEHYLS